MTERPGREISESGKSTNQEEIAVKAAMIGDNCMDVYVRINGQEVNRRYPTGNAVDTGVNLQKLGIPTSIISTTGNDADGQWMLRSLTKEGLDVSHLKVGNGATAVTYMDLNGNDRVHGEYVEGVLEHMVFDEEDMAFAAAHDLVHTALWGKAEAVLPCLREKGVKISCDYADRLEHPLVESTLPCVDYGFYSYHNSRDAFIEAFLKDKTDRGMKIAVATFGDRGSLAYDGNTFTECGVCPVKTIVNTVGAGDSYISGFLYGILNGYSVKECMEMGAKVSSEVIQVFEPWVSD